MLKNERLNRNAWIFIGNTLRQKTTELNCFIADYFELLCKCSQETEKVYCDKIYENIFIVL